MVFGLKTLVGHVICLCQSEGFNRGIAYVDGADGDEEKEDEDEQGEGAW